MEDRSKFYATKNLIQNTLVMGVSFGAGILLDKYTNGGNELKYLEISYTYGESAYGLFNHNVIYESAQDKYKTVYLSVNKTVCGIISILVLILTSLIMTDENNANNIKIIFSLTVVLFVVTTIYYKCNLSNSKNK